MKTKKVIPGDYANWVSGTYYPFPKNFIDEAAKLGISRRTANIPNDFAFGISRLFFVHPRAIYNKEKEEFEPGVIGFSIVPSIDLIVPDDIYDEIKRELEDSTMYVNILPANSLDEAKRGCGYRYVGMYIVAYVEADLNVYAEKYKDAIKAIRGPFFELKNPIKWRYNKFIGLKKVNPEEFGFEVHKPLDADMFNKLHISVNTIKRDLNKRIAKLKFAKSLNYMRKHKQVTPEKIRMLANKYGLDDDDIKETTDAGTKQ